MNKELKNIESWDEFEEYMKATSPQIKADMERIDEVVKAVGFVNDGLKECGMGMYLYNLDEPPIELENEKAEILVAV